MKKPIIFVVDDDPQVLKAVRRDLRNQYKNDYRVLATSSIADALDSLKDLKNKGETIALFLSDQRMPEMLGVEFLQKAKEIFPEAKRVLLTAYSDTDAAIKAINDVQLDFYLMKPWDPPEEKLYPVLDDLLDDWQENFVPEFSGIKVVGYQWSPKSHAIKDFLSGNLVPYQWMDVQSNEKAQELMRINEVDEKDVPTVFYEDGTFEVQPTLSDIAKKIGRNVNAKADLYDVVIIGAGPSGLAAGVYGGSEGLRTLLIERRAPGGQAGTSSRIENYLGFPKGLSGADLARRAITQATRFGIEFLSPQQVTGIKVQDQYKIITLIDGSEVKSRSVVITTGVDYRKMEAPGFESLTGAGIYYGAATTEAAGCKGKDVFIVGGGNSAGQGAMYLANFARKVYIVIRRDDLSSSMSQYLIDQIDGTENIEVIPRVNIVEAHGEDNLERVKLKFMDDDHCEERDARSVFIFIGAKPYTEWMDENIIRDSKGFVVTGRDLLQCEGFKKQWKLQRDPHLLETSVPGIFASGDVRSGAMNRVASAVGEGAMAIKFVHEYLAEV